jgi:hypothetical protein
MSNKNNLVACQLYPRLIYNSSPLTNLSAGFGFGNFYNASVGITHLVSPTLSVGAEADYCQHTGRIAGNFVLKQMVSRTLNFQSMLHLVKPKV